MDPLPSSSSSGRVPVTHPYPPKYGGPGPQSAYQGRERMGDQGSGSEGHMLEYQKRREQRHSHGLPTYASDNPYDPSHPSHPSYTSPTSYNNDPTSTSPLPNRLRSTSDSSIVPVLASSTGSGNKEGMSNSLSGAGGLIQDYPDGWTKEDEDAEREFLSKGMIDWKEVRSWRFWIRKEWWFYYLLAIIIGVLVCLMSLYHDQIVDWLTPVANWMKSVPAGWAIPIGVFFVISFPPLFGHEILGILVGAVWGLWVGFGITAAGTFIGEVGNFYAFKYCLRSRAAKHERANLNYACMAHVVREGGFLIIFAARLSAIPGHFTTAVFSTCGMNIWIFMVACILTMPKQLIVVYLGVIFSDKDTSSKNKIISDSVLSVGFLITIGAAWYIWKKMHQARVVVWRKRRIEAAARGLVLNPVTGSQAKRASYKEWDGTPGLDPEAGHVDDGSRSPILQAHRHQSYQNPYDIRYHPADNMSVYDVDAAPREADIASKYGGGSSYTPAPAFAPQPHQTLRPDPMAQGYMATKLEPRTPSPAPSAQYFPEARSTGMTPFAQGQGQGQGNGVKREVSQAPTMYSADSYGSYAGQAEFPVPLPLSAIGTPQAHAQDVSGRPVYAEPGMAR